MDLYFTVAHRGEMRLTEQKIDEIERTRECAFAAARGVPVDRLDWKPLEVGQSVMSMARELAKTPDWAFWVLTDAKPDDPSSAEEAQREEMASWQTLNDCEAACRSKLELLYAFYRSLTEADLGKTKWLPFNGGRDHSVAELLDYPRWNFAYHQGQIDYIGSLIGLKKVPCIYPFLRR